MNARAVQLVLKQCLGHRDGEPVLVVTDTSMESMARAFQKEALALGIDATLATMPPRSRHGEEPAGPVAVAMRSCPVAVLLTAQSLTHTMARREACEKHGVRIPSMPGLDGVRLDRLLDIDYDELHRRCDALGRLLDGARTVRLTPPAGADLT